MSLKPRWSFNN